MTEQTELLHYGGDVQMRMIAQGDEVIMVFDGPVLAYKMDTEHAYECAEMLARCAMATIVKEDVEGKKSALIEFKRGKCMDYVKHRLKSAMINKQLTTDLEVERAAASIVDDVLGEVL